MTQTCVLLLCPFLFTRRQPRIEKIVQACGVLGFAIRFAGPTCGTTGTTSTRFILLQGRNQFECRLLGPGKAFLQWLGVFGIRMRREFRVGLGNFEFDLTYGAFGQFRWILDAHESAAFVPNPIGAVLFLYPLFGGSVGFGHGVVHFWFSSTVVLTQGCWFSLRRSRMFAFPFSAFTTFEQQENGEWSLATLLLYPRCKRYSSRVCDGNGICAVRTVVQYASQRHEPQHDHDDLLLRRVCSGWFALLLLLLICCPLVLQ